MRSLTLKLTLAFLTVSLAGIALVAFLIWGKTYTEFDQLILDRGRNDFINALITYYETNGSWDGVVYEGRQKSILTAPPQPSDKIQPPQPFVLIDGERTVVIGGGPYHLGDVIPEDSTINGVTIFSEGKVIGTVITSGNPPNRDPFEERYLSRTNSALLISALGAISLALVLGIFLARTITRPVRELTSAASMMASGKLGQKVPVRSKDELGILTTTFNQMSTDLEYARQLRRQMTADIAHDLRTPLTVITGYLESLRDGVLKSSPERYEILYNEARHLQRLVEDLRTLSLADAGELTMICQPGPPGELIDRLVQAFQYQAEQQNINLETQVDPDLPDINIDTERMESVLANLTINALRYTPQGGKIIFSATRDTNGVILSVKDNGTGITAEDLPRIFERFYRGDESRQQQGNESGLGLAISKSIVELHGGKISAYSDGIGHGTIVTIYIPMA